MSILILAEHDQTSLSPATLHTIGAASQLDGPIDLMILGSNIGPVAQTAASIVGIEKIIVADHPSFSFGAPEFLAPIVAAQVKTNGYSHILAPATAWGKNLLPRIAALLDVQPLSDVIAIESADTFQRPFYAGNAIATVQSTDSIKAMTIRATAFPTVSTTGGTAQIIQLTLPVIPTTRVAFVRQEHTRSERPDLSSARIIVSGGRGVGSAENFSLIEKLADTMGAAIGASRAAVDAGYVTNDAQVGQTGKIVAPELYIAIGISGAIQHQAGMKDSRVIVAINKDPDAPIFQISDYGLVADLFEAVPELTEKLSK